DGGEQRGGRRVHGQVGGRAQGTAVDHELQPVGGGERRADHGDVGQPEARLVPRLPARPRPGRGGGVQRTAVRVRGQGLVQGRARGTAESCRRGEAERLLAANRV